MISTGLALAALSLPAGAACDSSNAQWVAKGDSYQIVLYGTKGLGYGSKLYLEEWRGDKLAWRARGSVACSNGASICYAMMRTDYPPSEGQLDILDLEIEEIDENDDLLAEWVVLPAFAQKLYSSHRGLKVEWFNGFKLDEGDHHVLAPNIYKLDGCPDSRQKLDPRWGIILPDGPIYGIPELCSAYLRDGSFAPDPISGPTVGTWWMDDRTIGGQDGACDIAEKKTDGSIDLICQDSYGVEELVTRKYREEGKTRFVDDIEMTLCKP